MTVSDYSKLGPKFRITITEPVREDLDFGLEVGAEAEADVGGRQDSPRTGRIGR